MSSTTPRVGFYMPADDGSEPIDVATDLNDNLEKMDGAVGFAPATSSVDPTNLYDGKGAYETDTGRAKFRKSSVWAYLLTAGASFLSNVLLGAGYKLGIGTASPAAYVDILQTGGSGDDALLQMKYNGQSFPRFLLSTDGLEMGGGAGAIDVAFMRTSAGQINITGSVNMSSLAVSGMIASASLDLSGDIDVGGNVTSPLVVQGKLSGTGSNVPNYKRKSSDTARTSTTTTTNDPDIFFAAAANTTYFVQVYIMYSANTTADFKFKWDAPVGSTGLRWCLGEPPAGTDRENTTMRTAVHNYNSDVQFGGHSTAFFTGALDSMVITTAGTAGNITMQWSQNTSDANATTLRAGTVLVYRKLD